VGISAKIISDGFRRKDTGRKTSRGGRTGGIKFALPETLGEPHIVLSERRSHPYVPAITRWG
jgi:hypothetical protein